MLQKYALKRCLAKIDYCRLFMSRLSLFIYCAIVLLLSLSCKSEQELLEDDLPDYWISYLNAKDSCII